jgi:kynurenine formamidase
MGRAWLAGVEGPGPGPIDSAMLTLPPEPTHILLISTGHSQLWGTERYYGQAPYLTVEAAETIRDAGFGVVGLDFPSPDEVGSATEPCHHVLLGASKGQSIPAIRGMPASVNICADVRSIS